ncbi:unnamed protein product [Heterobilharzia americana]|nr:unnamed protein product [Heterobilharzia americana]
MGFCKISYGYKQLRITVTVLNLIVIGCAVSIITVGGIFYHSVRKHSDKLHETIKRIITCLATVAAFMVLIGFLGLFGVCLESPDILSLYSVGLFCIILLHLGTGIACLLHQGEMWDNLHLIMKKAVETYHTDRNMGIMLDKIHRNVLFQLLLFRCSFIAVEQGTTWNMAIIYPYHAKKMVSFT